jgi:Ca2+-binding RTX toxin-like protein
MAAPHVAGAAAVLAEVAPGATLAEVTAALSAGPQILDPRNQLSRPRLDLEAAVQFFHCYGAQVTIRGTNGDDRLVGTPGHDVISGLGGDDVIEGLGGSDKVCGGDGRDRLDGGVGADAVVGDKGDDTLRPGEYQCHAWPGVYCIYPFGDEPTSDQLIGGPGFDTADYGDRSWPVEITIDGLANDGWPGERDNVHLDVEAVVAGSGDDRLVGSGHPEHLNGGAGDDVLRGGPGIDVVACGPGTDRTEHDQWDFRLDCELFLP